MAHGKGLALVCRATSAVPALVVGDPDRVRQVLTNVLGNAVKFTSAGDVVVTLDADPVEGSKHQYLLRASVRDTGPGIPPDVAPRIFEAFQQGDASLTRAHGGTGLGLAIARRLVERMGGGSPSRRRQARAPSSVSRCASRGPRRDCVPWPCRRRRSPRSLPAWCWSSKTTT
jgi:signal transduction histidine kinase